ncbi:MAG: hypothetical protein WEA99_00595 [Brumimicrobium sp.]
MSTKQSFLNRELWLLTFQGAFQRAKIYTKEASEKQRKQFREALSEYVEQNLLQQYHGKVNDEKHIENIHALIKFTEKFEPILKPGKLYFGVAQKILNLYLKYQWCVGNSQEPPHFPVYPELCNRRNDRFELMHL